LAAGSGDRQQGKSAPSHKAILRSESPTSLDAKAELGQLYSSILKADGVAWDVYLLLGRDAEWKDKPPVPVFVMDKIDLPNGERLDGDELARELSALRNSSQPPR